MYLYWIYGGLLKWWVSPTTIGFPTKNDHHFGVCFGGKTHHLRKHPGVGGLEASTGRFSSLKLPEGPGRTHLGPAGKAFVSIVRVQVMHAHAGENPAAVDSSELQQVSMSWYFSVILNIWGKNTASLTTSPTSTILHHQSLPLSWLPLASGKQASAPKTWLLDGKINGECCEVIGYMADTSQVLFRCSAIAWFACKYAYIIYIYIVIELWMYTCATIWCAETLIVEQGDAAVSAIQDCMEAGSWKLLILTYTSCTD